jgi:hypothetical protein
MRRFLLTLTFISSAGWSQPAQPQAQPPIIVQVQMPPAPKHYLQIAALVAVGVALMQWHLQRQKQTQDLFEKRFKVYETTLDYLRLMSTYDGKTDLTQYHAFRTDTDPAEFMFGSDVFTFITDVGQTGLEFRRFQRELDHHVLTTQTRVTGSNQAEMDRRFNESLLMIPTLQDQVERIERRVIVLLEGETKRVFRRYLTLHHDRTWLVRAARRINRLVDENQPEKLATRYDS